MRSIIQISILLAANFLALQAQNPKLLRDIANGDNLDQLHFLRDLGSIPDTEGAYFEAKNTSDFIRIYRFSESKGLEYLPLPDPSLAAEDMIFVRYQAEIEGDQEQTPGILFQMGPSIYRFDLFERTTTLWLSPSAQDALDFRDEFVMDPTSREVFSTWTTQPISVGVIPNTASLIEGHRLAAVDPLEGQQGMQLYWPGMTNGEPTMHSTYTHDTLDLNLSIATVNNVFICAPSEREIYVLDYSWSIGKPDYFRSTSRIEALSLLSPASAMAEVLSTNDQTLYYSLRSYGLTRGVIEEENETILPLFQHLMYLKVSTDAMTLYVYDVNHGRYRLYYQVPLRSGQLLTDWYVERVSGRCFFYYLLSDGQSEAMYLKYDSYSTSTRTLLSEGTPTHPDLPWVFSASEGGKIFRDTQNRLWHTNPSQSSGQLTVVWDPEGANIQSLGIFLPRPDQEEGETSTAFAELLTVEDDGGLSQWVRYQGSTFAPFSDQTIQNGSSGPQDFYSNGNHWYFWAKRSSSLAEREALYMSAGDLVTTTRLMEVEDHHPTMHHHNGKVYALVTSTDQTQGILESDGTVEGTQIRQVAFTFSPTDSATFFKKWLLLEDQWINLESGEIEQQLSVTTNLLATNDYFFAFNQYATNITNFRFDANSETWASFADLSPEVVLTNETFVFEDQLFIPDKLTLHQVDPSSMSVERLLRFYQDGIAIRDPYNRVQKSKVEGDVVYLLANDRNLFSLTSDDTRVEFLADLSGEGFFADFFPTKHSLVLHYPSDSRLGYQPHNSSQISTLSNYTAAILVPFKDGLVFTKTTDDAGEELWFTDGSELGTRQLSDLNPGPGSSFPRQVTASGSQLLWAGFQPGVGRELFLYCDAPDVQVLAPPSICAESTFEVQVPNAGPGATYQWSIAGATLLSGQSTSQIRLEAVAAGMVDVSVFVTVPNGCSNASETIRIPIEEDLPDSPLAVNGPSVVCGGETVTFQVSNPTSLSYQWSVPSGARIISGQGTASVDLIFDDAVSQIEVFAENACGISASLAVAVTVIEPVDAGPDQFLCDTSEVLLAASEPVAGFSGQWSILSGDGGSIEDIQNPNATFYCRPGETYFLEWQTTSPCGMQSDYLTVTIEDSASITAGPDRFFCDGRNTISLQGNLPPGALGTWRIVSGLNGTLINPTLPNAVFQFVPGRHYELAWDVTTRSCGVISDEVVVESADLSNITVSVGPDLWFPIGEPGYVAANSFLIGSGRWRIVSGPTRDPSLLETPNERFSNFAAISYPASFLLEWRYSYGDCFEKSVYTSVHFFDPETYPNRIITHQLASDSDTHSTFDGEYIYTIYNSQGSNVETVARRHRSATSSSTTLYTAESSSEVLTELFSVGDYLLVKSYTPTNNWRILAIEKATFQLSLWVPNLDPENSKIAFNDQVFSVINDDQTLYWRTESGQRGQFPISDMYGQAYVWDHRIVYAEAGNFKIFDTQTQTHATLSAFPTDFDLHAVSFEDEGQLQDSLVFQYQTAEGETGYAAISLSTTSPAQGLGTQGLNRLQRYQDKVLLFNESTLRESGTSIVASDGTPQGTQPLDWSIHTDEPGGRVPRYSLDNKLVFVEDGFAVTDLNRSFARSSDHDILAVSKPFKHPLGDTFFFTRDQVQSNYEKLYLHQVGQNPADIFSIPLPDLLDNPQVFFMERELLVVGRYTSTSSQPEHSFRAYRFGYHTFADEVTVEYEQATCLGGETTLRLNVEFTNSEVWHPLKGQLVSQLGDTAVIKLPSIGDGLVRVTYRTQTGERKSQIIHIPQSTEAFTEWGQNTLPQTKVTDLVELINACHN